MSDSNLTSSAASGAQAILRGCWLRKNGDVLKFGVPDHHRRRSPPPLSTAGGRGHDDHIEPRAWAHLAGPDGKRFLTFAAFCSAPEPYGLDTPEADVRTAINELLGRRAAKLATVAPAAQGVASGPEGPKSTSNGSTKRARAIAERAPKAIRELYKRALLTEKEAASFGRTGPLAPAEEKFVEFAKEAVQIEGMERNIVIDALGRVGLAKAREKNPENAENFNDFLARIDPFLAKLLRYAASQGTDPTEITNTLSAMIGQALIQGEAEANLRLLKKNWTKLKQTLKL